MLEARLKFVKAKKGRRGAELDAGYNEFGTARFHNRDNNVMVGLDVGVLVYKWADGAQISFWNQRERDIEVGTDRKSLAIISAS